MLRNVRDIVVGSAVLVGALVAYAIALGLLALAAIWIDPILPIAVVLVLAFGLGMRMSGQNVTGRAASRR